MNIKKHKDELLALNQEMQEAFSYHEGWTNGSSPASNSEPQSTYESVNNPRNAAGRLKEAELEINLLWLCVFILAVVSLLAIFS